MSYDPNKYDTTKVNGYQARPKPPHTPSERVQTEHIEDEGSIDQIPFILGGIVFGAVLGFLLAVAVRSL